MVNTKPIINKKKSVGNVGKRKGATGRDVNSWRLIKTLAKHLKQEGKLTIPNCADLVKTSHGRERAPQNPDWYYIRCAAVLRAIYMRPGNGCGALSVRYGIKKNRGSRPEITTRASKGLLRWCCKSLEGLKLISKGKKEGRVITKDGRKKVDTIAFNVLLRRNISGNAQKTVKK